MRRDVVGLGVVLAVSGLAYGSSRSIATAVLSPSPVMRIVAAPISAPAAPSIEEPARPKPRRFTRREAGGSIAGYVQEAAARHGVPASLVAAVISVESEFNPRAISHRGALGLMQLMPGTAALLGVRDALDPRENVDAGARHLRDLLDRFANDVSLALAAYNAGAQAVIKHGGVPPYPETRTFVARVLGRVGQVAMPPTAYAQAAPPPRVRFARHAPDHLHGGDVDAAPTPVVLQAALTEDAGPRVPPVPLPLAAPRAAVVEPPASVPAALTRSEAP